MRKNYQGIMVWLLPLIVFGGIFYPLLGYFVLAMMIFFLILSYFKGRFWCSHLCPRGAFLDIVWNKVSLKKNLPGIVIQPIFRWAFFSIFMAFFLFQIGSAPKTLVGIGNVFVRMCMITTLIAIIFGFPFKARIWCAACPMGTLQGAISKIRK